MRPEKLRGRNKKWLSGRIPNKRLGWWQWMWINRPWQRHPFRAHSPPCNPSRQQYPPWQKFQPEPKALLWGQYMSHRTWERPCQGSKQHKGQPPLMSHHPAWDNRWHITHTAWHAKILDKFMTDCLEIVVAKNINKIWCIQGPMAPIRHNPGPVCL